MEVENRCLLTFKVTGLTRILLTGVDGMVRLIDVLKEPEALNMTEDGVVSRLHGDKLK